MKLKALQDYLILTPLYLNATVLFKSPFEFYLSYLFLLLFLPFFMLRYPLPKKLIVFLLGLLIMGMFPVLNARNEMKDLIKIWTNITVSSIYFYYVLQYFEINLFLIFKRIIGISKLLTLVCIFQFISYKMWFMYGYWLGWLFNKWSYSPGGPFGLRLNGFLSEPSYLGAFMAPVVFISLYKWFTGNDPFKLGRIWPVLFLSIYIMSFSSVANIGLVLALVMIGFRLRVLKFLPLIFILVFTAHYLLKENSYEYKERFEGFVNLVNGRSNSAHDVHGSSFVLYNNAQVAFRNLMKRPLLGNGLGGHDNAYDEFSLVAQFGGVYNFNGQDGNSTFIRMTSELGLMGIFLIFFFISKTWKVNDMKYNNWWLMNSAAYLFIFLHLLRQGNYTYGGFFLFLYLAYYSAVQIKKFKVNEA